MQPQASRGDGDVLAVCESEQVHLVVEDVGDKAAGGVLQAKLRIRAGEWDPRPAVASAWDVGERPALEERAAAGLVVAQLARHEHDQIAAGKSRGEGLDR